MVPNTVTQSIGVFQSFELLVYTCQLKIVDPAAQGLCQTFQAFVQSGRDGLSGNGLELSFQVFPARFFHDQLVTPLFTFSVSRHEAITEQCEGCRAADTTFLPVDGEFYTIAQEAVNAVPYPFGGRMGWSS